jgi:hypothetical protein
MFCPLYQHFYLKDRVRNKFQDEFPNTSNTLDVSHSLVAMATTITELCVLCEIYAITWLPLKRQVSKYVVLACCFTQGMKNNSESRKNCPLREEYG